MAAFSEIAGRVRRLEIGPLVGTTPNERHYVINVNHIAHRRVWEGLPADTATPALTLDQPGQVTA